MNAEIIRVTTGGSEVRAAIARTIQIVGEGTTRRSDGNPDAVWFGIGGRATGSVWPNPLYPDMARHDLVISVEGNVDKHRGAKAEASQLFDLLAANTDWGLDLWYFDDGDGPSRSRPPRTELASAG